MWKLAALLVGLAATALLAFGIVDGLAVRSLLAEGVETSGRVVRVGETYIPARGPFEAPGMTSYEASVQYVDESGASHAARSIPTFHVLRDGELMTVWYPRGDPGAGRAFAGSPWYRPSALLAASVLTAALAYAAYCASRLVRARAASLRA